MWVWKGFIIAALLAVVSTKSKSDDTIQNHLAMNYHPQEFIAPICITDKDGKLFCLDEAKCSSCATIKDERKKEICLYYCERKALNPRNKNQGV
ncbi:unnamed protein product [Cylicocyclus nassatus]|uniref:Uncharacterized protein n=1 Tax=Cylicocyclus nassatus TaxID=53992 RepID=A0AA36MEN2_CYLNA|nr:unnamed protein product [Cylicocyclus nassatus]